ncbi:MAG: ATP-grasp fold amidoligase family protein [Candidatus Dadabacteria bacterium]
MRTESEIIKHLYNLKLSNNPYTFTEKVRWKMKYDRRPILTTTTDKYKVIDYLKVNGLEHLAKKQYFITDRPDTIPFSDLPEKYVIKSSHKSGDIILIDKGKDLTTKALISKSDIISKCELFLKKRHWNEINEWAYQDIKPMIIVEEFLEAKEGSYPVDYKFLCFDGKAKIVEVTENRYDDHANYYFDRDWNKLRFTWSNWPGIKRYLPEGTRLRPKFLDEMIETAELLSKPFDFVRVDLFCTSEKIYFGEFTHYPAAGIGKFNPESFDEMLGGLWTLPDINTVRNNSFAYKMKNIYQSLYTNYRFTRYMPIFGAIHATLSFTIE